jgi:hypothetical protein
MEFVFMEVEKEMEDFLKKQEEIKTDRYQCQKCGSLITMPKGEIPERCYQEQGGCNVKHKQFKKIELDSDGKLIEIESKKKTKDEIKIEKIQEVRRKEAEVEQKIKDITVEELKSNVYTEMDAYTDMVSRGINFGCVIEGSGGTGKTYRVINRLKDVDYAYTDSFTTPQAFYIWMFRNRHKEVLIIDDVAGFMNNDKVLAFLKGGLWEVNGQRIIHYMTTKPMQDELGNFVPNAFILNARMVIITNKLNKKNPHLNAVLTRVNYCRVEIDHEELMEILKQVTEKDYPGLSLDERMEVFKFIEDNTSDSNDDLNIRSLIKCFQHKIYSNQVGDKDLWKRLALLSIIQKNPQLVIVEQLLADNAFTSEEDRVIEFKKQTGKSRATYFRLKEQLQLTGESEKKTSK